MLTLRLMYGIVDGLLEEIDILGDTKH